MDKKERKEAAIVICSVAAAVIGYIVIYQSWAPAWLVGLSIIVVVGVIALSPSR